MAFTFVQGATHDGATNPSLAVTPTTNNLMVVFLMIADTTVTPGISDTQVNTWTHFTNNELNDGHADQLHGFYAVSKNSSATTINFSGLSAGSGSSAYAEYSGNATTTPEDGDNFNSAAGSGAVDGITTGSITTTVDGDLIVACCFDANRVYAPASAGTGFTARATASKNTGVGNYDWMVEDKVQTTHGAINPTFTDQTANGGDVYTGIGAAFKVSAGAATDGTVTMPIFRVRHRQF